MRDFRDVKMVIDLSYMTDPNWWGRKPAENKPHNFKNDHDEAERHRDTASRLIELAAWNMREAARIAAHEAAK